MHYVSHSKVVKLFVGVFCKSKRGNSLKVVYANFRLMYIIGLKLQNRAARNITFSNYDSNTDEPFRDLNWSKLNLQRAVSKAIMMYNTIHNQTPGYLSSRFIPRHEVLSYSLRNNECKLSIPQPRTNYCKRSFSYSGAVLWNSLPREIKQSNSLKEFKTKLKNHTFQSELI